MIEKATIARVQARSPWIVTIALAALAVGVVLAGVAISPYLFKGATLEGEVARQVRATTGLVISRRGPARFELLPHPHLAMQNVHIADPSGTLTVDADSLNGDVRLLPLLVGRLELSAATLVRPKLSIDLDGRPMPPDSTLGRALRMSEPPKTTQRLGIVTLVDGSASVRGRMVPHPPTFEAINVTVDWRDLESPASLTGSLAVQSVRTEIAAWVADPSGIMRGDHSDMTLRLQSAPLDVTATGDVSKSGTGNFRGRLSVSVPSLPAILAIGGYRTAVPAPFANVALTSDATIGIDRDGQTTFDLPSLHLRLDGNDYEGTLAFQGGEKPALSGTLATEQLVLAPFLFRVPTLVGPNREWAEAPMSLDHVDPIALDLRISATHLRAAPFVIDDTALAVMTRNDRTEIALVEGKAYGGAVKGRISIGVTGNEVNLRAAGSLSDADASALSWDAFGRSVVAGTVSGAINLDASGTSPASMMAHLQGWAKGQVSGGELSGLDLGRGLREIERHRVDAVLPALNGGRTSFTTLAFSTRIADGIAAIDEGVVDGADARFSMGGQIDIGHRTLDLRALAAAPDPGTAKLRFDVSGTFDKVLVRPDIAALLAVPKVTTP